MNKLFRNIAYALKSRPAIIGFTAGMLLGSLLTLLMTHLPQDILSPGRESKVQVDSDEFDPFVSFDIPLNDRVEGMIRYYIRPERKVHLVESYKRSGKYLPMVRAVFEEYNLPQAFIFLPILESGFSPGSRSRAGATGLWQLMPATASEYGLKYTSWIDERRDPEKSTVVAAEMLRDLHEEFGSWELALAAYNCGHARLKRVMRREKTNDYWALRRLPRETYNFVPRFYAILHLIADPDKYGLTLPDIHAPLNYETIDLEAAFSLDQIASLARVSPGVIKSYNPALISSIAPSGKYTIRVPVGVKEQFIERYNEQPPEQVELTYTTYRVRKGDSLYKIARKFGTTIKALKADNNLRSARWIKAGQILKVSSVTVLDKSESLSAEGNDTSGEEKVNRVKFIYTVERDSLSVNTLARYYATNAEDIKSVNPWMRSDRLAHGEEVAIYKSADSISMHKTRRGDSLWRLARRYGTTVANLKRWNQLQTSRIHPGQRLIVGMEGS